MDDHSTFGRQDGYEALQTERDLLNTIMDSTQAQIAYLDPEFNFVRVNAAYCQGSGHTREDLIGRNHFDLFPDDKNRAIFEQVRDTGEAVVFRAKPFVFHDQPERETTYWDWVLTPVKGREGHVQGLVLSLYEVTERERARLARLAHLARLNTLIDVSKLVLAETSMEGVLARVVDAACELTGARIGTSGHGYRDGTFQVGATSHAADVPPCPPGEVFALERGGVYQDLIEGAVSIRLSDGEMRAHPAWWELPEGHAPLRGLLGARLMDRDGRANGLIMVSDKVDQGIAREFIARDFTAEDEALLVQLASLASLALWHIEARMESERLGRQQELLLNSAGEGVLGLDERGGIAFANPAAAAMVGWTADELIGKPHHDTVHHTKVDGTPYPKEECLVTTTLTDGATFSVGEEVFWRKDGTSFPVEYTSAPITEDGVVAGAVLVFRDITEQQQALQVITDLARFPSENPNPVIRISREGVILYANEGSESLLAAWGVEVGRQAPDDWRELVTRAIAGGVDLMVEIPAKERTFALAIVPFEEYVNLYGLDVTSLKQIEEALNHYADRLWILREIDRAILLAAQTPERIAVVALGHLQRLIPFLRASVTLFDVQAGGMSLLAVYPPATDFERERRYPLEEDEFLAKLGTGQVHLVEDLSELALPLPLHKTLQAQGVRAYANVPLLVQGVLIGSLNLGVAAPGMLGEPEIEIAREIADELAIGIQQVRLLAQVQRHAEELEQQVRRRTAALRASRARFHAVFEDSALGIALVNRKGQVIDSNPALQEMLGYSQDELEGMVFARLAHPDNLKDDADLYEELMAGERAFYRLEGRYLRKDGQPIHANLTVSLVRPTKGRPRFAIALVEDMTGQKRAQTALIEAEKLALTGRLAASLAHEINNPMQSVIGYLSLIQESLPDRADAREYLEIALEELERAAGIVARMRDLSRPSDPGGREPVDVNALVERVLLLTQIQCQNQHIEVQWEAAEGLPLLSLAPDRMQQVFLNLVLNAVDAIVGARRRTRATEAASGPDAAPDAAPRGRGAYRPGKASGCATEPDGGRLRVYTAHTPETPGVQIVFADNGVGIPPDEQRYLFEPFHTTKQVGLGLGLYISQRIVQDHGGRIEVASQEGVGTTFTVWLPCQGPAG